MVKLGHKGPKETTYIEQGVGLHIEMITGCVNGWCAGGKGGLRKHSTQLIAIGANAVSSQFASKEPMVDRIKGFREV